MKLLDLVRSSAVSALVPALSLFSGCSDDLPQTTRDPEGPEPVAVTVFTEKVELYMEYPRLVPGLEARFLAHVTVLATGEPVRTGRLTLELSGADNDSTAFEAPHPTRDGLFIPVGSLQEPGSYAARIVVQSEQVEETVLLEPIVVYPDLASAHRAAAGEQADEPKDAVPFLLEQQWKIGLLLDSVATRTLVRRLQVPGEVEAPRAGSAVVSAPLGGRLVPPESGVSARIGDRVEAGQVLAYLEPPLSTADVAQRFANALDAETLERELLLREFDLETQALEVELSLHQSRARLEFAEQALARLDALQQKGLGTQTEIEAGRRDLEIARREHAGAQALASSYGRAQERLATLRAPSSGTQGAPGAQGAQGAPGAAGDPVPLRLALRTPIAGEIVEARHVQGEHVEAHATIYRVLDLETAWITTHVSEFDLHEIEGTPGARVEFSAHPGRSFDVLRDLGGRLLHVGRVVDPADRTVVVRYEVQAPPGLLRVGMFADVLLETSTAVAATALPREAVVMDDGLPVAFVLLHGELFQKRRLELGIQDGSYVEVLSGVAVGERVATRGAYLVKLASASPAAFGEGHAH